MKSNKLTIQVEKPIEHVFEFTTNPKNTPSWIDNIEVEEASEWPINIGTTYRNRSRVGNWTEYVVTALDPNSIFELADKNGNYHVRYSYKKLGDDTTEMEYFEWVDEGDINGPFTVETMNKLKTVLEVN